MSPSKQARLWLGKGLIHLWAIVMDSLSLHPDPVLGDARWSQARVGVAGLGAGEVRFFYVRFWGRLFPSSFFLRRREASRSPWSGLALSRGPREASGDGGGGGEVFLGATLGVAGMGVVVALRMVCGEVLCV